MNLYFGDFTVTMSTILLLVLLGFIGQTIFKYKSVVYWGRQIAIVGLLGLLVCCLVATRDEYHLSVQASFDAGVTAGLFTIGSIQSILCCICGGVIALTSLSCIFVKNQKYRKMVFFILSSAVIIKVIVIEISRWMV